MKKLKLIWQNADGVKRIFVNDLRGRIDGRDIILTKNTMAKLVLKLLYWNLNSFSGEGWGNALCYVEAEEGERRVDSFVVRGFSGEYFPTSPVSLVDCITRNDRSIEFNY